MPTWFVALVVAFALQVVSYMLAPKPKSSRPAAAKDLETPTADAGRPIPVIWGTLVVKGLNTLWHAEKSTKTYRVNA